MEDNSSTDHGSGGWFQDDSRAIHSSSRPAVCRVPNRPKPVLVCSPEVGAPALGHFLEIKFVVHTSYESTNFHSTW